MCTKSQISGQNHKNPGIIRAIFPKCPDIRASPDLSGRLGRTASLAPSELIQPWDSPGPADWIVETPVGDVVASSSSELKLLESVDSLSPLKHVTLIFENIIRLSLWFAPFWFWLLLDLPASASPSSSHIPPPANVEQQLLDNICLAVCKFH